MKAIILSAGQGKRLLPLSARTPKCLLPVRDQHPALGLQLRALAAGGVKEACVVVGFQAQRVDAYLRANPVPGLRVETLYNPFYAVADNLISCWIARSQMRSDFVLMNGDTVFAPELLQRLLAAPPAAITLAVDQKDEYDADDMKVSMGEGGRLEAVSKLLAPERSNAESIGLMRFRGRGPSLFCRTLEDMARTPRGLRSYYLAAIDRIAATRCVRGVSIRGLWWAEIDTLSDLMQVRHALAGRDRLVSAAQPYALPDAERLARSA